MPHARPSEIPPRRGFTPAVAATLVVIALAGCRSSPPAGTAVVEIDLPLQGRQLVADPPRSLLYRSQYQSANLVRVEQPIEVHQHDHSEETVYVISGRGTLFLAAGNRHLKAGDFAVIPRGTLHGFTPEGNEPTVVLSIFCPEFQEGDRIYAQPPAAEE